MRGKHRASSQPASRGCISPWNSEVLESFRPSFLLLWAQRHCPVFSHLSHNITREVASYLNVNSLLPWMYGSSLYVVNLCLEKCYLVSASSLYWYYLVPVDSLTVVCVAWTIRAQLLYWLNMPTLELTAFTKLHFSSECHYFHYCYLSGALYVFGKVNQKYTLSTKHWSVLPCETTDIHYIAFIFPHAGDIFLISSFHNGMRFQVFSTLTEKLGSVSALSIPFLVSSATPRVLLEGKQLMLADENTLWSWDLSTNRTSCVYLKGNKAVPYTSSVTLLRGREMVWVSSGRYEICTLDIDTLEPCLVGLQAVDHWETYWAFSMALEVEGSLNETGED